MNTDSIWKDNFKQDINRVRVLLSRFGNTIFCPSGTEITSMDAGDKWCYADDYIKEHQELSNKVERLEKELSGLKNTIICAKDWLSLFSNLSESDIDDLF